MLLLAVLVNEKSNLLCVCVCTCRSGWDQAHLQKEPLYKRQFFALLKLVLFGLLTIDCCFCLCSKEFQLILFNAWLLSVFLAAPGVHDYSLFSFLSLICLKN